MKKFNKKNVYTVYAPKFNDTLHADGSKTYETCNYGFITIKNPNFVNLIKQQIKIDGSGWYYMDTLIRFKDSVQDIYDEFQNAMRILD